jgi:hypothetical protein
MVGGLRNEDPDFTVLVGMLVSLLGLTICGSLGVYYLIKGILQSQTNYQCEHCKTKFHTGLMVQHPDSDDLLRTIRKK